MESLRRLILIALVVSVSLLTGGVLLLVERIFDTFGPAVAQDLEWRAVRGARELAQSSALGLAISDDATATERWSDHEKSTDVAAIVAVNASGLRVATHGTVPGGNTELFAGPPDIVSRTDKYYAAWSHAEVEGGKVGKVAVVISTNRLHESRRLLQQVRAITGASAALALIGGFLFLSFFTAAILRRDRQLAEYAATLERKVEERTAELDERNRGMRLVLDNVSQGFVTVSLEGAMDTERSAIVDTWLGPPEPGTGFADYIRTFDATAAAWFAQGLVEIADDVMPLELLIDQLPRRLHVGDVVLRMGYIPITHGDRVDRLLVVMTDITADLVRERMEREQKEMLSIFQAISSDRAGFNDFLAEARALMESISQGTARTFEEEKRLVHTLKGNAGLHQLQSLVQVCHEAENRMLEEGTRLSPAERSCITATWRQLEGAAASLLGESTSSLTIDLAAYRELRGLLDSGAPRDALVRAVESWTMEPVSLRLERLGLQARQLSSRLGKPPVVVKIDAQGLRLPPGEWSSFWSAFVHVVRNAVDHGIEPADERQSRGKPPSGTVWLTSRLEGDVFVVSVRDDGRGIDWEKLARKAAQRGLATNTREELEAALFADGVSTREEITVVSGRGVGMAAVRQVVLDKGGVIAVHSEASNGTTFEFRFPRSLAHGRAAA